MGALQNGTPSAYLALALRHDPYDVERLVSAARTVADVMLGEATFDDCRRAYNGLREALVAFPEESPPERPLLALYSPSEPIPPGGGRYATAREYRERILATTLSAAEYRRFAAGRRKGVQH